VTAIGQEIVLHTPGPWQFYADLPSADPNWHIVTNVSRMRVLANVHIEPGNKMDLANAHLITAAPDLLAGAKAMLAARDSKASVDAVIALRDAIAKAEGRS
jgi:hypothetical protein